MELSSTLTMEMLGKPFLLEKRIRLLHAITEHGSISQAAKAVPMSYKSAWEAVEMMNNLAPQPIVARETGGKNGGGTTVTAFGRQLLDTYRILKEEHEKFLDRLSSLRGLKQGDIQTIGRLSLQISARNQIQGRIVTLAYTQVDARVSVRLKNGNLIHSVITKEAAENLALQKQEEVSVIFKSSSVKLVGRIDRQLKEKNTFEGEVTQKRVGEERIEMCIDIGASETIIMVTDKCRGSADIEEGCRVVVSINENDVMIGK